MTLPLIPGPYTELVPQVRALRDAVETSMGSGDVYDSSDYASLSAAVTAIGSAVSTLRISTSLFPNGATCTVPATLTLEFVGAGTLTITTSQTVTIQSDGSNWPIRKIFYNALASQGTVLCNGSGEHHYLQWRGVVGDQSNDDAAAIQATIDGTPDRRSIFITPGLRPKINSTVTIQNRNGLRITSSSSAGDGVQTNTPRFYWGGAAGGKMIYILDSRSIILENFAMEMAGTNNADFGIDIDQSASPSTITTNILLENLNIGISAVRATSVVVRISEVATQNVEHIKLRDCLITASSSADSTVTAKGVGIKVGANPNAKGIEVIGGQVVNGSIGIWLDNGSLHASRILMNGNGIDFKHWVNTDPTTIEHIISESARQFFEGGGRPVTIRNCSFGGSPNASYPWINVTNTNGLYLVFEGNQFDNNYGGIPTFGPQTGTNSIIGRLSSRNNQYNGIAIADIGLQYWSQNATSDNDEGIVGASGNFAGRVNYLLKAANYTATAADSNSLILVDATGANRTITLPDVSAQPGLRFSIAQVDGTANTVSLSTSFGGFGIGGTQPYVIATPHKSVTVIGVKFSGADEGFSGYYFEN